jgi:putative membrane protein
LRRSVDGHLDLAVHVGIRYLWGGTFAPIAGLTPEGKHTPVIAIAILLILIGLFAFFAVLFRIV